MTHKSLKPETRRKAHNPKTERINPNHPNTNPTQKEKPTMPTKPTEETREETCDRFEISTSQMLDAARTEYKLAMNDAKFLESCHAKYASTPTARKLLATAIRSMKSLAECNLRHVKIMVLERNLKAKIQRAFAEFQAELARLDKRG